MIRDGNHARETDMSEPIDKPAPDPKSHEDSSGLDRPTVIGPYTIVSRLGAGGMGDVYRALQEEPLRREVALKVIKLGMDTREVVERFALERQVLALLDHPSIAKVYDAGATEEGRPYFAMELVEGVPLHEYCDAKRLTIRERVELFVQVGLGIQHAHQRGIIHRDLKPSNVLVTEVDGRAVPKVIDFGIAKATAPDPGEGRVTSMGQMVGTPAYMSPEQADGGGDLDVRSDVYSLGVMLYEVLAGALPFTDDELSRLGHQLLAVLLTAEPPRPSVRLAAIADTQHTLAALRQTNVESLRRSLNGELDWVVMRAIEKDRHRRYASVADLIRDLRAFLNHEPVEARPPSAGYRARKFVRRHRGAVLAVSAVLATLLGGLVAATTGFVRADRNATLASQAAARAEAVSGFLDEMLTAADPVSGGGASTVTKTMELETLGGSARELKIQGSTVSIDGSRVTQADIACSNGVIHAIDTVMLPPRK